MRAHAQPADPPGEIERFARVPSPWTEGGVALRMQHHKEYWLSAERWNTSDNVRLHIEHAAKAVFSHLGICG
jgi:hypothetical protein